VPELKNHSITSKVVENSSYAPVIKSQQNMFGISTHQNDNALSVSSRDKLLMQIGQHHYYNPASSSGVTSPNSTLP
jgi:hypothetical protein